MSKTMDAFFSAGSKVANTALKVAKSQKRKDISTIFAAVTVGATTALVVGKCVEYFTENFEKDKK